MNTSIAIPGPALADVPTTPAGFHDLGFARFDGLIDADELTWLRRIYDELFADPRRHPGFIQLGGTDASGSQLMPQIGSPHRTHPELLELRYVNRIAALARDLLGPQADLVNNHMILKPAGSPRDTPWHQDQAYHSPAFRYRKVNFWLPLDGATIDEGCLWFIPRSHTGPIVPHENVGQSATAVAAKDQAYWQSNGVAVPVPLGSVSAHHSYCLHYAGPNRSSRPRRAWILVYGLPPEPLDQPLTLPWMAERREILAMNERVRSQAGE